MARDSFSFNVRVPDAEKQRAARLAYRAEIARASDMGVADSRSWAEKLRDFSRRVVPLREILETFFAERAADGAKKPWICEAGVGSWDRCEPEEGRLLPRYDETTAFLNRLESVLRLANGSRFSKRMLERLIEERAMFIYVGARDSDRQCRNQPMTARLREWQSDATVLTWRSAQETTRSRTSSRTTCRSSRGPSSRSCPG